MRGARVAQAIAARSFRVRTFLTKQHEKLFNHLIVARTFTNSQYEFDDGPSRGGGGFGGGRGGGGYRGEHDSEFRDSRRGRFEDDGFMRVNERGGDEVGTVKKNFYEKPSNPLSPEEIKRFHAEHSITVAGQDIPEPIMEMGDLVVPDELKTLMKKFDKPTPIQSICWPITMTGRNIVGIAQTGSGKTLGFLLPGLIHAAGQDAESRSPKMLVILPTRELAQQVHSVSIPYERAMRMKSVVCFGGSPRGSQEQALRFETLIGLYWCASVLLLKEMKNGVDIVYGTPGRLMDFINSGSLSLRNCSYVVLDEADRMLDMGFEPQIKSILSYARRDRQTCMFTATWPEEVKDLAKQFLGEKPVLVNIGSLDLTANKDIKQIVEVREPHERVARLMEIMEEFKDKKVLIFGQTKRNVDGIVRFLDRKGFRAMGIHGDKTQAERDSVIRAFQSGRCTCMVATDVAARGLDVRDIDLVINFEFPSDVEDYVHRIGRTGRAGDKGTAISFVGEEDGGRMRALVKIMRDAGQEVSDEVLNMAQHYSPSRKMKGRRGGGGGGGYRGGGGYGGGGGGRW